MTINSKSHVTLLPFMITDLNLKGIELIIYAIIYGFNQDDMGVFYGSLEYLATWTNSTKQGVMKALNSLLKNGLISKSKTGNKCFYKVNQDRVAKQNQVMAKEEVNSVESKGEQSCMETVNSVSSDGKQSCINIKDITNNDNKDISEPASTPKKTPTFSNTDYSECMDIYYKNRQSLNESGISTTSIIYKIPVYKKLIKEFFITYGVEDVKKAVTNSVNNYWIKTKTDYSLRTVFNYAMFDKYIADERGEPRNTASSNKGSAIAQLGGYDTNNFELTF